MLTMEGRTCVFAGGTGAIAREALKGMLSAGMNVVLLSHNPDGCAALKEEFKDLKGELVSYSNRLPDEEVYAEVKNRFGSLDVFISKTGILKTPVFFEQLDADQLVNELRVQVGSVVKHIQNALPYLKASKAGRIVLFSTIGSLNGYEKENIIDSVCKGAINSLVYAMAREFASYGITVNCIAFSGMMQDHPGDGLDPESEMDDIPLNRCGTSADFAAALEYLISEEASFVTGEVLKLSGGMGTGL